MKRKRRLDLLLLEREFFKQRSQARGEIMAGRITVEGKKCDKPGTLIDVDADISVEERANPYVSRGGLKIAGAAEKLGFALQGKIVLDSGASTGGFTDFALKQGARKVYAVDVGYGQLNWNLRNDDRVVIMERFNVRYLKQEHLQEIPDVALLDLSFISLAKVIPPLLEIGIREMVALVKPQFEAGRKMVGKKGVVKDPGVHVRVLREILEFARQAGLREQGATFSPLKGPEGNIEYFIWWKRTDSQGNPEDTAVNPEETVSLALDFFGTQKD